MSVPTGYPAVQELSPVTKPIARSSPAHRLRRMKLHAIHHGVFTPRCRPSSRASARPLRHLVDRRRPAPASTRLPDHCRRRNRRWHHHRRCRRQQRRSLRCPVRGRPDRSSNRLRRSSPVHPHRPDRRRRRLAQSLRRCRNRRNLGHRSPPDFLRPVGNRTRSPPPWRARMLLPLHPR